VPRNNDAHAPVPSDEQTYTELMSHIPE